MYIFIFLLSFKMLCSIFVEFILSDWKLRFKIVDYYFRKLILTSISIVLLIKYQNPIQILNYFNILV